MYAQNLGDVLTLIGVHHATITADGLSAAFDLAQYEGEIVLAVSTPGSTGNADNRLDINVHDSIASGGTYAAVTEAAFTQIGYNVAASEKISINSDAIKQFIKINFDATGTNPSYPVAVHILGVKKNPA